MSLSAANIEQEAESSSPAWMAGGQEPEGRTASITEGGDTAR